MLLASPSFGPLPAPAEGIAEGLVAALLRFPGLELEPDREPVWLDRLETVLPGGRERQPPALVLATCLAVHERLLRRRGHSPAEWQCLAALPAARLLALVWQQRLERDAGNEAELFGLPQPGPALDEQAALASAWFLDAEGQTRLLRWHAPLLATAASGRLRDERGGERERGY